MDGVVLGYHKQSRRLPVEAVNDSGTPRLLATGAATRQRLRERAGAVTARGMNHDAGGLVDDQQVPVLVGHGKRHVHRLDLGHLGTEESTEMRSPPLSRVALRMQAPLDPDPSGVDQVLGVGAGPQRRRQEYVEPRAGRVVADHKLALRCH